MERSSVGYSSFDYVRSKARIMTGGFNGTLGFIKKESVGEPGLFNLEKKLIKNRSPSLALCNSHLFADGENFGYHLNRQDNIIQFRAMRNALPNKFAYDFTLIK